MTDNIGPDKCGVCGKPKTVDSNFHIVIDGLTRDFRCERCYDGGER